MSQQANIESQKSFGDEVNNGTLSFGELVASDSVDHDPAPGQGAGPQGFTDFFTTMRAAFPDLHIEVETLLANDTDVAFAYTLTGTHQGPFLGFAPTQKSFSVRGMQISRFADGKLTERWGSTDELGILQQLGHAPTP